MKFEIQNLEIRFQNARFRSWSSHAA